MSPEGAQSWEGSAGVSVVGSGSRLRMALIQTREASAITMMTMSAKKAARMPSTVVFVTIVCMSPIDFAGATTLPASIASCVALRWAKKPIFGLSEKTL